MQLTRRSALRVLAGGAAAARGRPVFEPTWESLKQYRCPAWFKNAKFGIWSHWGPQCVPRQGDWYARNMYIQGTRQYNFHVQHFGHPSKFGYKDVIPLWKAENWDPEALMRRYKKAGARYFVALGVHCDNFDCWNSKHHRWNSVNFGPKKDIVGLWRKAALNQGLRFGVTEHLAWSYSWFNVNKGADKEGPLAGARYDGNDPNYQDLYFEPHPENTANYTVNAPESWKQRWFNRIKDLVDQHRPDLVYTDGGAFGEVSLRLIAHYYNENMKWRRGRLEGVYTLKHHQDQVKFGQYQEGATVLDVERGLVEGIRSEPWHMDTCVGQWYYYDGFKYKTAEQVICLFLDAVSRNGTLLLNLPLLPDGTLDPHCDGVLEALARWFAVNQEAIYETHPWKTWGEGPTVVTGGMMQEKSAKPLTAEDVRFTSKGDSLYAFCAVAPERELKIKSLGAASALWPGRISRVRVVGLEEEVNWSRESEHLRVKLPRHMPCEHAFALKIQA